MKTTGYVIVSHGMLAEGLKDACRMLCGLPDNFYTAALMPDDGPEQYLARLREIRNTTDLLDKVTVFADIKGGTPCKSAMQVFTDPKYDIISGVNLPMLLETVTGDDLSAEDIIFSGKLLISDIKKEMSAAGNLDDVDD